MSGDVFIFWTIIAGLGVAVALFLVERKNKEELHFLGKKKKVIDYYLQKLSDVENICGDNKKKIEGVRVLSKKLFNEYYGQDLNASYSQLASFFKEKNKLSLKEFSEILLAYYYTSKNMDDKILGKLISILRNEIIDMPFEKDVEQQKLLKEIKEKEEVKNQLLQKTKMHLSEENHQEAEKTYYELEQTPQHPDYYGRMQRLYDRIIGLYYRKKKEAVPVSDLVPEEDSLVVEEKSVQVAKNISAEDIVAQAVGVRNSQVKESVSLEIPSKPVEKKNVVIVSKPVVSESKNVSKINNKPVKLVSSAVEAPSFDADKIVFNKVASDDKEYKENMYYILEVGMNSIQKGDLRRAIDCYQDIKVLYGKLKKGDSNLHKKILEFYSTINSKRIVK